MTLFCCPQCHLVTEIVGEFRSTDEPQCECGAILEQIDEAVCAPARADLRAPAPGGLHG